MIESIAIITEMGEWSASTRTRALRHVIGLRDQFGNVTVSLPDDRPARRPGRVGQARYFAGHAARYAQRRRALNELIPDQQAILVQRGAYPMGPAFVLGALDSFAGRVVLDLDDALFTHKPSMAAKGRGARWLYGPHQVSYLVRRADHIVVSTDELAAALPSHTATVEVLPTVPDVDEYERRVHTDRTDAVVLGWVGNSGGLVYLDPLRSVLSEAARSDRCETVTVSDRPWSGPSRDVVWQLEDRHRYMSTFDIGMMPLPDTPYTRAKAGFKLLEYMAAGIPVIASPVGVNRELVTASGAGLLASTADEWAAAIDELTASAELRALFGQRGRSFVEKYADPAAQIEAMTAALDPSRRSSAPAPVQARNNGGST